MVSDNDISYAESEIRRMENELAQKRQTSAPDLAEFEAALALKKRNFEDMKNRKRRDDDQKRRDDEQKKRDDRRARLA